MTDTPPPTVPAPEIEQKRQRRPVVSAVWLIPIVAVLIALAIAYQSYANRGVLIAIAFPDASGVEIGATTLRYREVTVGVVEDVGFSADLSQVNVYVRVSRNIAPYLDEDAAFWVVQPEVTTRGIEGLGTILSGTYIEGTWDSEVGEPRTAFVGDDRAPIVPPGVQGTAIVLASREPSRLGPGAPILYRGIEVGEVAQPSLSPDGSEVRIAAFVRAPYDRQLSTATRFWDASGISVDVGVGGIELNVGSLATLVEGGLNFDTLISGGSEVSQGHVYTIFPDESAARASTFESPQQRTIAFSALFPSSQQGLQAGAPVRYRGTRVGSVASITSFLRPDDPLGEVQVLAVLNVQPVKMGLERMVTDFRGIDFVSDLVDQGLRARPASTGLFGGTAAVDLVVLEDAPPARVEIGVTDTPLLPTAPAEESGLAASATGVLDRLAALPIEQLLTSATDLLDNVNRIAADESTRAIPGAALTVLEDSRGLIADGRAVVSAPEILAALTAAQQAADDLAGLSRALVEQEVAQSLSDTLGSAGAASENIARATQDLDSLVRQVGEAVEGVQALLADDATLAIPGAALSALEGGQALIRDGRNIISSPQVASVLIDVERLADDLSSLSAEIVEAGLATQLTRTLDSAQVAAANIATGTAELDAVTEAVARAAESAATLLEDEATRSLPNAALGLISDGRALVGGPEVTGLINALTATAADIQAITGQLATERAAERLTETLRAAEEAARSIASGTESLPSLSASAERVLAQAEELGAGLNRLTLKAEDLALEELVTATTDLMQTADLFLSSDEAGDVPVVLSATLEEIRATVETIRTGGLLTSASAAADSIALSTDALPALLARLSSLSGQAGTLLQSYSDGSRVNQELFAALRAATRAAEDVSSLSRTIERNPNSLLLGR